MKSLALALVCVLQIPSTAKADTVLAQSKTGDIIADFLLQKNSGGRMFASREANAGNMVAAVRVWREKSQASRVQALEGAVSPGTKLEAGLIMSLSHWKGDLRVKTPDEAAAFLKDAADAAEKLTTDAAPAVLAPDGKKSVERARQLSEGVRAPIFGGDRYSPQTDTREIAGGNHSKVKLFVEPPALPSKFNKRQIDVPPPFLIHRTKLDVSAPQAVLPPNAGIIPNDPQDDRNKTKLPDQL